MAQQEKIAIVTGASSGVGKATALALMKAGYTVVLAGRRKDALEATAAEGKADGGKSLVVPTDVTDPCRHQGPLREDQGSIRPARPPVQQCRHRRAGDSAGRPDLSSNGSRWWTPISPAPSCAPRKPFKIMKAQTPRGGRIINNGSISAAYAAAALVALYSDQARHHRPHQIDRARRARLRHRLRPDRYRQCGDRDDRAHDARACRRPTARRTIEPTHGRRACRAAPSSTWRACRSTRMCSS